MRTRLLLSLIAALAQAAPGGWDGGEHSKSAFPVHSLMYPHSYSEESPHGQYGATKPSWSSAASSAYTKASWSNHTKDSGDSHNQWESTTCTTPAPSPVTTKPPQYQTWTSTPCTTSTLTCPHVCHLDFFGTFLAYPTAIEYSSVYAQTINAYITDFSDGSPQQSSEETVTAPPAPPEPPLTWTAFGVVLTAPTTYVAYTSIDFATVVPLTAENTCATTSAPLSYPTIWPSLIAPSSLIQQPSSIPPATIIAWLDSLPTVQAQLGGGVCDPANGGVVPFAPTATVTSATTIDGNTRIVHSTTVVVSPMSVPTTSTTTTTTVAPVTVSTTSTAPTSTPTRTTAATFTSTSTRTLTSTTASSSTSSVAVQTSNAAAMVKRPRVESWLGNIMAGALLVL